MIKRIPILCISIILGSCAWSPFEKPVILPSIFTQTVTENIDTPTIQEPFIRIPSQPVKMERWMEYERALALELLGTTESICEWEILGHTGQEVYVWAECQINDLAIGTATSVPSVLYLGGDDSIGKVEIPGDGTKYGIDIRKMFPPELLEQIFSQAVDTEAMWSHLQLRHKTPEPPLIVLSGGILP